MARFRLSLGSPEIFANWYNHSFSFPSPEWALQARPAVTLEPGRSSLRILMGKRKVIDSPEWTSMTSIVSDVDAYKRPDMWYVCGGSL